jgi:hypothetical protein
MVGRMRAKVNQPSGLLWDSAHGGRSVNVEASRLPHHPHVTPLARQPDADLSVATVLYFAVKVAAAQPMLQIESVEGFEG